MRIAKRKLITFVLCKLSQFSGSFRFLNNLINVAVIFNSNCSVCNQSSKIELLYASYRHCCCRKAERFKTLLLNVLSERKGYIQSFAIEPLNYNTIKCWMYEKGIDCWNYLYKRMNFSVFLLFCKWSNEQKLKCHIHNQLLQKTLWKSILKRHFK